MAVFSGGNGQVYLRAAPIHLTPTSPMPSIMHITRTAREFVVARLRRLTIAMLGALLMVATVGVLLSRPVVRLVLDDSHIGAAPVRGATALLSIVYTAFLAPFLAAAIVLREWLTPTNAAERLLITMARVHLVPILLMLGPRNLLARRSEG